MGKRRGRMSWWRAMRDSWRIQACRDVTVVTHRRDGPSRLVVLRPGDLLATRGDNDGFDVFFRPLTAEEKERLRPVE